MTIVEFLAASSRVGSVCDPNDAIGWLFQLLRIFFSSASVPCCRCIVIEAQKKVKSIS
jgi:hypothetical protein